MKLKRNLFSRYFVIFQFIFISSLFILPVRAAGEVDTSFIASAFIGGRGTITQTLVQPDGKIIIAGDFQVIGKYGKNHIARLNADGTPDLTFNPVELREVSGYPVAIRKLAFQSNGQIIVGGVFKVAGQDRGLIRLNTDGSIDSEFINRLSLNGLYHVWDFEISTTDKIIYGGVKSTTGTVSGRLNSDGTLDTESAHQMTQIALQPDGKIIAYHGNVFNVVRYNPDFTIDNTFQSPFVSHSVLDIAIQADGKVILVGALSALDNFPVSRIARLNTNGSLDSTFNIGTAGPNNTVKSVKVLADGKILIGGDFTAVNNTTAIKVARLNPSNGSLDTTFDSGIDNFELAVNDLDIQPDGKIITASYPMFRLNPNGTVDPSLTSPIIGDVGFVQKTFVQPDGKILVGGYFSMANEKTIRNLARFNADGTVDNSFDQTFLPDNGTIFAIAVQANGNIIAGGDGFGGAVQLTTDGSFITFINTGQIAYDIKIQPDGKILVAGLGYVKRFNADGTPDESFASVPANNRVYKMVVLADGKILVVGSFTQLYGTARSRVARLNADGTLDVSFNPPGGANATVYDIVLQADGKFVIGGEFTGVNFDTTKKYLARLNSDGSLDAAFSSAVNFKVKTIRIQPDGKILAGGLLDIISASVIPGKIARVNADGTLDATFNNSIAIDQAVNSIDLQAGNKIILGGFFSRVGGVPNLGVARLLNSAGGSAPFDFDGDGKTDLAVYRAPVGEWWVNRSSNGTNFAVQFGPSNYLTPGDFTGDGKTDISFWRPNTGEWFVLRSEDFSFYSFPFGVNNDIPAVADFDADGKDDAAIFRPSDGTWYIKRSSDGGVTIQQFGQQNDQPVPADYDGDGKADIAVYRRSGGGSGTWWINRSTGGILVYAFGGGSDQAVPGDYTGDGKADVAFYRASEGEWYIVRSEDQSYYSVRFGLQSDQPAPGDYDGDGKFDLTVFRDSTGTWYSQRTTSGLLIQNFGQMNDIAVPRAFVR